MSTKENKIKFHTLDELLPKIDADARAYADTFAGAYVIGVEYKGESYPIQTTYEASDADIITAELTKALEYHFAEVPAIDLDEEEAQLLEGFTFVPNKGMAQILIGKRNRLYLKGDIATQLDITPGRRVLIAYNPAEKAFAIVKPTSKAVSDDMRAAGYFVSKRKDVTCAKLFREFKLDEYEGTTYYADTASLSGNVVIFKR